MTPLRVFLPKHLLAATAALLFSSAVPAADTSAFADAQAIYRQELLGCSNAPTAQDRSSCRSEARRALDEARNHQLLDRRWRDQQSALQRCGALSGRERGDCEMRNYPPNPVTGVKMAPEPASVHAAARYKQEMATCDGASTLENRSACRQDAKVGYAEAMRGGLNDVPGQYRKNQVDRCDVLTGSDRRDCRARTRGEGVVEGTVESGAIVRETITIVPGGPVPQK